jgi:catechol-2,3-dioxygenase
MGSIAPAVDFDHPGDKVVSPVMLAHVVLRTAKFREMEDFYVQFLGGKVTHGNDFLSFITYDEEHVSKTRSG